MSATTPSAQATTAPASPRRTATTWALLAAVAVTVNLAIRAIADLSGAALVADNGGTAMAVSWGAVIAASALPLVLAVIAYALVARRVALLRRLWTPGIVLVGVLSLVGVLGAEDVSTAIALGAMHLVVAGVAAFGPPARLGR